VVAAGAAAPAAAAADGGGAPAGASGAIQPGVAALLRSTVVADVLGAPTTVSPLRPLHYAQSVEGPVRPWMKALAVAADGVLARIAADAAAAAAAAAAGKGKEGGDAEAAAGGEGAAAGGQAAAAKA
jgi:hypothetical protein